MVVRLDGPMLADQAGQVLRGGVGAGEAGDGVDGLAGGLAGGGVLPPAGDLDCLAGAGEIQAAGWFRFTSTSRWPRRCPPCSAAPRRWTRVPSARRAPREVLPSTATAVTGCAPAFSPAG